MRADQPHIRLVEGYRKRCLDGWASGPDDGYFFQRFPYHLQRAGLVAELKSLLLDFEWTAAKLRATDVTSLLVDFSLMEPDSALASMRETLRLCAHAIAADPAQLAAQLSGRIGVDDADLGHLVSQIGSSARVRGLIPLRTGFHRSGGALANSFAGHQKFASAIAIARQGDLAASAADDEMLIWETGSGRVVQRLAGHVNRITALGFSADGSRVIAASKDATLRVWSVADGRPLVTMRGHSGRIRALGIGVCNATVISVAEDATLRVWDIHTGAPLSCIDLDSSKPSCLAVLPGTDKVAVGLEDGSGNGLLAILDIQNGQTNRIIKVAGRVNAVAASPGRELVAAATHQGVHETWIRIWDMQSGSMVAERGGRECFYDDLAFSADGSLLIVAPFPKPLSEQSLGAWVMGPSSLKVLSLDSENHLSLLTELSAHTGGVSHVVAASERNVVLSCGQENLLRVWYLDRIERHPLSGAQDAATIAESEGQFGTLTICSIAIDPDATVALTVSLRGLIQVWALRTGKLLRTIDRWVDKRGTRMSTPPCLIIAPGGRTVVLSYSEPAGGDSRLVELNWETGEVVRHFPIGALSEDDGSPLISSLALTPEGLLVASCFYDELLVWDFTRGERIALIQGGNAGPFAPNQIHERYPIALMPDSRQLVWANSECELQVVDLATRKTVTRTETHEEASDLKVLSDGRHVLVTAYSKGLFLIDLEGAEPIQTLIANGHSMECIAVTADCEYALSCSEDSIVRAWHLPTKKIVATLYVDAVPTACALAPDGEHIVIGDRSGGVDFVLWRR